MARPWHPRYHDDVARKTAHLSFAEHGAYALLMDQYYRTGEPLPADRETLFRICRGSGAGERKALTRVLNEFFEARGDRLHNTRCDEELSRAQVVHEQRVKGGKARAHAQHMLSTCSESAPAQSQVRARALQSQSHKEDTDVSSLAPKTVNRPIRWTDEMVVPAEWREAAAGARADHGLPGVDLELEADKFGHWAVNAKPKKDWRRAFINWCLNAKGVGYGSGFNGQVRPSATAETVDQIFREIADIRSRDGSVHGDSGEANHHALAGPMAERQGPDQ